MPASGKRVSFVELYIDLIFVLAVGQLSHLIVAEPVMRTVWIVLGLFFTLWWTWVGFAVLYNRHGADAPRAAAAVPGRERADGGRGGRDRPGVDRRQHGLRAQPRRRCGCCWPSRTRSAATGVRRCEQRIARAYLTSAALFAVSIAVPEPWRYALWAIAIAHRVGRDAQRGPQGGAQARRDHDWSR